MTKTKVVSVRVSEIRPAYKDLRDWCQDTSNVYIGRQGVVFVSGKRYPKRASIWANPFKITKTVSRKEVMKQYKKYILEKIKSENLWKELKKLRGKRLGCWCHPEPCHGDILVKLIAKYF